jgi:pilus assembly protein Flp/PilA
MEMIKRLYADEEGATMVEYALMIALIAVVCIAVVQTLGNKTQNSYNATGNAMSS